jgi:orotidine-5'-phosphate decarboxylase
VLFWNIPMADVGPKIIVAMDFSSSQAALRLADQLDPKMVRLKVGKQLFTSAGPSVVTALRDLGFEIFLDLKFHDIPNTVAQAVSVAADLGVWMVNVHATGGSRMMSAARDALATYSQRPLLIAVTVLTSMAREDLAELGWDAAPIDRVTHLAGLAAASGLDGVVCSAAEAAVLSERHQKEFCLVTPGIRLAGDDLGDQRRVVTPVAAITAGATHLVIGRPITNDPDPAGKAREIQSSINNIAAH